MYIKSNFRSNLTVKEQVIECFRERRTRINLVMKSFLYKSTNRVNPAHFLYTGEIVRSVCQGVILNNRSTYTLAEFGIK